MTAAIIAFFDHIKRIIVKKTGLLYEVCSFVQQPRCTGADLYDLALHHLLGMEYLVELLCSEEAERDACLLQADVLIERLVCRLGGVLVANVWIERCDEHERAVQVLVHLLAVRLDADGAAVVERLEGVGEQARRLQEVVDDDGHEDVELEIAL